MAKIVVTEFVTLDGVMQAPGGPDEDRSGGFEHGGWQQPYGDDVFAGVLTETMGSTDALLLGRKTYEIFAGYWPDAPDDTYLAGESLAARMNGLTKHVASRTLPEPLDWRNSSVIRDIAKDVPELRGQPGGDILVFGSGEVVRTLIKHDLLDELKLAIYPLMLGSGKRLFAEGLASRELELVEVRPSTTGVLLATYRRAKGD